MNSLVVAPSVILKTLYTFVNCQRPVFLIGVSHHKHKITSLWKFGLNWSSKLRENDERKTPLLDEFVGFQIGIKYFQQEVFLYLSEKLPLSQNIRYFRGSRFPQYFIISTALKCSLPNQFLSLIFVLSNNQACLL